MQGDPLPLCYSPRKWCKWKSGSCPQNFSHLTWPSRYTSLLVSTCHVHLSFCAPVVDMPNLWHTAHAVVQNHKALKSQPLKSLLHLCLFFLIREISFSCFGGFDVKLEGHETRQALPRHTYSQVADTVSISMELCHWTKPCLWAKSNANKGNLSTEYVLNVCQGGFVPFQKFRGRNKEFSVGESPSFLCWMYLLNCF